MCKGCALLDFRFASAVVLVEERSMAPNGAMVAVKGRTGDLTTQDAS